METTTLLLQSALTPAFLLVALGSMLNLFAGRLARIIDRSRELQSNHGKTSGAEHDMIVAELRGLVRRINTVNWAIALGVLSAIVVSILIGILFLMGIAGLKLATHAALSFLLAICLMAGSLVMFIWEVRLATRNVRIHEEYLELPPGSKRRHNKPID
jgi:ABC-type siderophore export system fused ATPase/permease subunit